MANRLENIASRYVFQPLGLSASSVKILGLLRHKRRATPGEILSCLGGTKSNISQRLRFLEKEGLIKRLPPRRAEDKRHVSIVLTAAGRRKLKIVSRHFSRSEMKLEEHFNLKEIQSHLKFFQKLHTVLNIKEKILEEQVGDRHHSSFSC
jgi:DNA-binding MarR family transcriptional regulator